jgi:transposase
VFTVPMEFVHVAVLKSARCCRVYPRDIYCQPAGNNIGGQCSRMVSTSERDFQVKLEL